MLSPGQLDGISRSYLVVTAASCKHNPAVGEDFQSNFNISDTSVSLKVRREGCFASGAEGVIEKSGQLRPLLQVLL